MHKHTAQAAFTNHIIAFQYFFAYRYLTDKLINIVFPLLTVVSWVTMVNAGNFAGPDVWSMKISHSSLFLYEFAGFFAVFKFVRCFDRFKEMIRWH